MKSREPGKKTEGMSGDKSEKVRKEKGYVRERVKREREKNIIKRKRVR